MARAKLTSALIESATCAPGRQIFIWDSSLRGFALRLTSSDRNGITKSFIVEKRVAGRTVRSTIAQYPQKTVQQARAKAQSMLGDMADGIDLIAKRRELRAKQKTLGEAWADFQEVRSLKNSTRVSYDYIFNRVFSDWLQCSWLDITGEMVMARHKLVTEKSGPGYANSSMRVLRSILSFSIANYRDGGGQPLTTENPVSRLSATKAWNKIKRRKNFLRPHELPAWWAACLELPNDVARDYLLFVLMTGLRRREAEQLLVDAVDLEGWLFTVADTKNDDPLPMPLTPFLYRLVEPRVKAAIAQRKLDRKEGKEKPFYYVFPAATGDGPLVDPRRQQELISEKTGKKFTIHDLRRTFITVAESLDISSYALKAMLNHRSNGGDVTGGYIQIATERLRGPMQKICEFFLSASRQTASKVVPLSVQEMDTLLGKVVA